MIKLIFFSSMSITSMITMFSHPWDGITRRQVISQESEKDVSHFCHLHGGL